MCRPARINSSSLPATSGVSTGWSCLCMALLCPGMQCACLLLASLVECMHITTTPELAFTDSVDAGHAAPEPSCLIRQQRLCLMSQSNHAQVTTRGPLMHVTGMNFALLGTAPMKLVHVNGCNLSSVSWLPCCKLRLTHAPRKPGMRCTPVVWLAPSRIVPALTSRTSFRAETQSKAKATSRSLCSASKPCVSRCSRASQGSLGDRQQKH